MMLKRDREDMDPEVTVTHLHGFGMPPDRREEMRKGVTDAADGSTGAASVATTRSRDNERRDDRC